MTSKSYFKLLSLELIEHILLEIIRPADLLSLALTERRLSPIIIPDFLEYCCLDFNIARWDVWEHLEKHPLACSRIGRLDLTIEYLQQWCRPPSEITTMLPQSLRSMTLGNCPDEELESNIICSAATQMSNLKLISIGSNRYEQVPLRKLFALLRGVYRSSCQLQGIEIGLPWFASWKIPEFKLLLDSKMLSDVNWLSSLSICRIILSGRLGILPDHNNGPGPELNPSLLTVLSQMPNLTHLQLETPDRRSLLNDDMVYSWPKLQFLHLQSCSPSLSVSMFSSQDSDPLPAPVTVQRFDLEEFITGHPHLHTIYLCLEGVVLAQQLSRRNVRDDSMVPALKNLAYTSNVKMIPGSIKKALILPIVKKLSHLTITPSDASDFAIFDELESLESCVVLKSSTVKIEATVIPTIFRGCKSLKKLSFASLYLSRSTTNDSPFALFQDLPNLTHLFGTFPLNQGFPGPEGDALLKRLYKFPKLRYIDSYRNLRPVPDQRQFEPMTVLRHTYVELRRDDIRQQMAYDFLEYRSMPQCCRQDSWGNFAI